jgi:DNA-directed RNA polymerase sigma subunit (sigma70/sigma32)
MKAQDFLEQVDACESRIENKISEIQRLEALATNISPHLSEVKVDSTPNPHRVQEVWNRLIEARTELMDEVDRLIALQIEVTKTLEMLPLLEYDVLYKIYISHYSVQQVAEMKNYTRQGIYDIKDRALEKLQKILDSR